MMLYEVDIAHDSKGHLTEKIYVIGDGMQEVTVKVGKYVAEKYAEETGTFDMTRIVKIADKVL